MEAENGFSELNTMFGGDNPGKIIGWFEGTSCIKRYIIILAIGLALIGLFIILLIIYLNNKGDSFKGKLPIAARGVKVSPARMKQQNSEPIHRYRGDASDGPSMPTLAEQVTDYSDLDNLNNPTLMDYQHDLEYDMYTKVHGFRGSNESPEHADTINPMGHYPVHPIKPEFPDQPIFHQNRLENILYHN